MRPRLRRHDRARARAASDDRGRAGDRSRFDGAAFDLSVQTVVTGAAHVGHWSFGPKLDPRPFQSCAPTGIPNGERDLIVIWRPGTNLNPYVSWPIAADESMPVLFVDQTATTLSGLLEELRSAVPATSTEPGTTDHRAPDSLVVFGLGIIAFAILVARPGRLRRRRA
jgi:hypothetical protein